MALNITLNNDVFLALRDMCIETFESGEIPTVSAMLMKLMDHPEVPIHYPYHHFIMPGTLFTIAAMETKMDSKTFQAKLGTVLSRAKTVPGGYCGEFGTCGAAVGTGIFVSVFTEATPLSTENWGWANEVTGLALQNIGSCGGPRCCKREAFLSIEKAIPYLNEKLGLHMEIGGEIKCKYSDKNETCLKENCPFFSGK